jgi:cytochrome c553
MNKITTILSIGSICFASSFITKYEYGKMLYENPRGISCKECHGEKGSGSIIAEYTHKKEKKILMAPKISKISYEKFLKKFKEKEQRSKTDVMPKYFLTEEELESIYLFLNNEK